VLRTSFCVQHNVARREGVAVPKVEDPRQIEIELDGQRAKIIESEYELSTDEWLRRRTEAFARLRKVGLIPHELLDLVENYGEQTLVELFLSKQEEGYLRLGIKLRNESEEDAAATRAELMAAYKRLQTDDEGEKLTASEALAFFLRMDLRDLKHAEKNRNAAPVRTLNLVPRSLIAEIAVNLLESCERWTRPPGTLLNSLIRELLNLDQDRHGMPREAEAQVRATWILAQDPTVRTRELARDLHVNASTVSRWRRSPKFKQLVEQKKQALNRVAMAQKPEIQETGRAGKANLE
jgi:hypothetical protein